MVRTFYTTHNYPFTWDKVVAGFWKRYPNPSSNHIISEDVIHREITPEGYLKTTKLIIKKGALSGKYSWAGKFLPGQSTSSTMPILEVSIVDPQGKFMKVKTSNFTTNWKKILGVVETLIFREDPQNKMHTLEKRRAIFTSMTYGLAKTIERFAYEKYRRGIVKTKNGFLQKLQDLYGQNQPV